MTAEQLEQLFDRIEGMRHQLDDFRVTVKCELDAARLRQLKILDEVLPYGSKRR